MVNQKMSGTLPVAQPGEKLLFTSLRMYRDALDSESKSDICVPRGEMFKFLVMLQRLHNTVSFEQTSLDLEENDQQILALLPHCGEIWAGNCLTLKLESSLLQLIDQLVPAITAASTLKLVAPGSMAHLGKLLTQDVTHLTVEDYEKNSSLNYALDFMKLSSVGNRSKLCLPVPQIVNWTFNAWTERVLCISTNFIWDRDVIWELLKAIKKECYARPEKGSEQKTVKLQLLNKETEKTMSVTIEDKCLQNITIALGSGDQDLVKMLMTCGAIWHDSELDLTIDNSLLPISNAVILAMCTALSLKLKMTGSTDYLEKLLNVNCTKLNLVDETDRPGFFNFVGNMKYTYNLGRGMLSLPVQKIVDWMFAPVPKGVMEKCRRLEITTDLNWDDRKSIAALENYIREKLSTTKICHDVSIRLSQKHTVDFLPDHSTTWNVQIKDNNLEMWECLFNDYLRVNK